jgi:hypothetical protein
MDNAKICSIPDCGKKAIARGWCTAHWTRWSRHGDPLKGGVAKGKTIEFFENALRFNGEECLIWPYAKDANGYAQINFEGKVRYVQREICLKIYGSPPKDYIAAHSCGNGHKGCVNPNHLRWASKKENYQDAVMHKTSLRGDRHAISKINHTDISKILFMRESMTQKQVAEHFGVCRQTISDIERNRRWKWVKR